MPEFIPITPEIIRWTLGFSLLMFFGTLLVVPWLITRIPEDYFSHDRREPSAFSAHHPLVRACLLLVKNTIGYLVVLLGLLLLFLPGQGILTIIVGMILIDFPGKYRLERWVVSQGKILKSINWIRQRAHKPPLIISSKGKV